MFEKLVVELLLKILLKKIAFFALPNVYCGKSLSEVGKFIFKSISSFLWMSHTTRSAFYTSFLVTSIIGIGIGWNCLVNITNSD